MRGHFGLILRQRNCIYLRRYGDIMRFSFLFQMIVEAEDYDSNGYHQDWQSRNKFRNLFNTDSQLSLKRDSFLV